MRRVAIAMGCACLLGLAACPHEEAEGEPPEPTQAQPPAAPTDPTPPPAQEQAASAPDPCQKAADCCVAFGAIDSPPGHAQRCANLRSYIGNPATVSSCQDALREFRNVLQITGRTLPECAE